MQEIHESSDSDEEILLVSALSGREQQPSSSSDLTFIEKVQRLMEITTGKTEEEIQNVLRENGENIQLTAAQLLCGEDEVSKVGTSGNVSSLCEAIDEGISQQMNMDENITLSVNRNEVWRSALVFYKTAAVNVNRLKKNLVVEFEGAGELGIDGGALKMEFFALLAKEIDWRLLEGNVNSRIPRKGCNNIALFKLAGMMLSHSIMQRGPQLFLFPDWLYEFMKSGDPNAITEAVSIDDIPKNSSNENIMRFITELDSLTTDDKIYKLLDENDVYQEIINQSKWPIGKMINIKTKHSFIQQLIINEVIFQRIPQIMALQEGLETLGVLDLVRKYPELCKEMFVCKQESLTSDVFATRILSQSSQVIPENPVNGQAHKFFMQCVKEQSVVCDEEFPEGRLKELLKFSTGHAAISANVPEIELKYLLDVETKILPEATACAGLLLLPTVHCNYSSFAKNMDIALRLMWIW